jgi:hypothetical protein
VPRILIVVEDRHAERELRQTLRRFETATIIVLTADALLAMILQREQIDARLVAGHLVGPTISALDDVALSALEAAVGSDSARPDADLSGAGLGRHLEYLLIPTFVRAVRNVAVLHEVISASPLDRVVVVGGGRLVRAARLVAAHLHVRLETAGASLWRVIAQAIARLRAGRHTRWVDTEFRALVLEPVFLLLLFAKGWWRRCTRGRPAKISRDALIITGDRWTAEVVANLKDTSRTVIVAGATQPGRALFRGDARAVPIEQWSEPADLAHFLAAVGSAAVRTLSRVDDPARPERFVAAGLSFWPLVGRIVRLHVIVWIPLLRHVQTLMRRVAQASPQAALLTSSDATAYTGALIEAARQAGIPSTSIQHGLMGEPNGHSVVRADLLAAWGAATEEWYRNRAPQRARFVVTGNPRFDTFPARRGARVRDPSRPFTVVVCTGFVSEFSVCASDALNLALIQATVDWAAAREEVRVVHKMHPGEEPGYYATAAAALQWRHERFTMTNEPILHDLLQSSDVLVTGYSTTVVESILLGTPVIVGDFEQRRLLPIDRLPGVTVASSSDELHDQLDTRLSAGPLVDVDASSAEAREYVFTLDGQATDRVAALIGRPAQPT